MTDISNAIQNGIDGIKGFSGNPVAIGVGGALIGASVLGAGIGIARAVKKKRKRSSTKKRTTVRRKRTTKRKYARTAGKRKDTSKRRIRMTKNGQPYVILASGKARFISKKSAKSSRKRKGGRY